MSKMEVIREILQDRCETGAECGVSFALDVDGQIAVDLWGGYADAGHTKPWKQDTIVPIWSISKTVTSLAIFILVDRRILSLDDKVAKHWPEFGAHGKGDIELRHVLSHTSGVCAVEEEPEPLNSDRAGGGGEKIAQMLAAQAPWWTPGTASGYHVGSWGHILGEIVRRATGGITLSQIIQTWILNPLEADYWLDIPADQLGRAANISPPPAGALPTGRAPEPGSICARTLGRNKVRRPGELNQFGGPEGSKQPKACSGVVYSNARALVAILSAISLGGKTRDGRRLLRPETVELIFQEQARGEDLVLLKDICWGIGYALAGGGDMADDTWLSQVSKRVCYWGGWGGSVVVMDLEHRLTLAFVMNKMENVPLAGETARKCVRAVYEAMRNDQKEDASQP